MSDRSQPQGRRQFLPVNYRGLLFDLFVFVFNVFLIRFLTRRIGGLLSQTFLKDDTEVYKQFVENESFRRAVTDMVFELTNELK